MKTKICLFYFSVSLLMVGIIAVPAQEIIGAAGSGGKSSFGAVPTVVTSGATKPLTNNPVTIPKDNYALVDTTGEVRDHENLRKRTPGCIWATKDVDFMGEATYGCLYVKEGCYYWNSEWRNSIRSFSPDLSTTCKIYTGSDCDGTESAFIIWPGRGKLGVWDKNMGSFRCWW